MDPTKLSELTVAEFAAVIALFLPGFVSLRVDRLIHPQRDAGVGQNLVEIVGYSLLNAGVLIWFVFAASLELAKAPIPPWPLAAYTLVLCLVGPTSWPVLFRLGQGWLARRRWILAPHRTAWDDFFSRREPCWVVVHLHNGDLVGGYFGRKSNASVGGEAGHIYIEELWHLDADGTFLAATKDSKGALFRPSDYLWVEMRVDD